MYFRLLFFILTMEFSRELLFFFSALGAFNGILLGIYFLFFIKSKKQEHIFLGLLLLLLSIRIGKSTFLFFNKNLFELFIQIGLSACFLIGPAFFLYVSSAINTKNWSVKNWWVHLVPFLILIGVLSVNYSYYEYKDLWQDYFIPMIYWQWLAYIIAGGFYIRHSLRTVFFNKKKVTEIAIWKISVFIGVFIIWIAYNTTAYTSYITGAISFTFIVYVLFLVLIFRRSKGKTNSVIKEKYASKKIAESEANVLIENLQNFLREEKLFKNANLKSSDLAKKMRLTTHQFSQLLNDNLGKNFAVFINEYRIEEAKILIQKKSPLTLESIGYECGFNSKSTFYTTFKKITGVTPAQYRKSL